VKDNQVLFEKCGKKTLTKIMRGIGMRPFLNKKLCPPSMESETQANFWF
jgi:hypothetical protein